MHKNFTFDPELQKEIKSRFYYMDENPLGRKRLFFEKLRRLPPSQGLCGGQGPL